MGGRGSARARRACAACVSRAPKTSRRYLRHERPDHTLQATALVHEAFLRLAGRDRVAWQNRGHFYAVAALMMRRILVDHAREHRAAKRPGAQIRVDLDDQIPAPKPPGFDVLMLDEALSELSAMDARQGRIVELRYFAGLSEQEVADTLSLSRATVTREWKRARAWLYHRMTPAATLNRRNRSLPLGPLAQLLVDLPVRSRWLSRSRSCTCLSQRCVGNSSVPWWRRRLSARSAVRRHASARDRSPPSDRVFDESTLIRSMRLVPPASPQRETGEHVTPALPKMHVDDAVSRFDGGHQLVERRGLLESLVDGRGNDGAAASNSLGSFEPASARTPMRVLPAPRTRRARPANPSRPPRGARRRRLTRKEVKCV